MRLPWVYGHTDFTKAGTSSGGSNPQANVMGLVLATGTPRFFAHIALANNSVTELQFADVATNEPYAWDYTWNPAGGDGNGSLTVNVSNEVSTLTYTTTINLTAAQRTIGASFDAFGITPRALGTGTPAATAFIDSVQYTAILDTNRPCMRTYPASITLTAGDTNKSFLVGIPPALNATSNLSVTLASLNPSVAIPKGAAGSVLVVTFPAGAYNVQEIFVQTATTNSASTSFTISNTNGVCVDTNSISITVQGLVQTVVKSESFDTAASARANGWWEWLTRVNGYSLGWTNSNRCGVGAGEAGGGYIRSRFRNGYADVFGNSKFLTLSDSLSATGRIFVGENVIPTGRPGIVCGHFDWSRLGIFESGESVNTLGVQVSTASGTIRSYLVLTDGTRSFDTSAMTPMTNSAFDWQYTWDPTGGAGSGRMITTVTGTNSTGVYATASITNDLSAADRAKGARFNAFGVGNRALAPEASYREGYFDNVRYTAITNDPVLPCILVYPQSVASRGSENTNSFALGIPPALNRISPATITVTSLNPSVAIPVGGDPNMGMLVLNFAAGADNVQQVSVQPTGSDGGTTFFLISNGYGVCVQTNVTVTVLGTPKPTITKTENFNSAPAAATNGWVEFLSRTNQQSYGFSATDNNGLGAGEAGGTFVRRNIRSYYADVTCGRLTLNDFISGSGSLAIVKPNTNNSLNIGHFKSADSAGGNNLIGVSISQGPQFNYYIGLADGTRLEAAAGFLDTTAFGLNTWSYSYDPTGGATGYGRLSVTLMNGLVGSVTSTLDLTAAQRGIGATFESFGIVNRGLSDNTNDVASLFLDNVTYSAGGAISILGIQLLTGNQLVLTFSSAATNHVIKASSSVSPASWNNVPGVTYSGGGPSTLVWNAQFVVPAGNRFYRVVGNPSP